MHMSLPDFAESSSLPTFEIRPSSLAASVPTAMVLLDYALGGLTATPTVDIQALAEQIPADLAIATHPVRAVLAHGTVLREVLLAQLPAEHPAHVDWPALRAWLEGLTDPEVLGLLDHGLHANLAFGDPTVRVPSPRGALAPRVEPADRRRMAAGILADWGLADAEIRAGELVDDPALTRARLVELLDVIWQGWLRTAWASLPPDSIRPATSTVQPGMTGSQWLSAVTGLRPAARYAEAADQAEHLVVLACPGLGQALTMFDVDRTRFVLHTPAPRATDRPADAVGLTDLGSLGTVLTALGDPTRLGIVLQLVASGPLTMTALTDVTGVHQSTVSRQVGALRKARLVELDEHRQVTLLRSTVEDACHTLLAAIQRPADPIRTEKES